jgi:hypothetical protein
MPPWKTRPENPPSAGTVICVSKDRITRSVTQAKRGKGKETIKWFCKMYEVGKGYPYKQVLSKKGLLVHLCMTYSFFTPFIKAFHLLSDSWRANRGLVMVGKYKQKNCRIQVLSQLLIIVAME